MSVEESDVRALLNLCASLQARDEGQLIANITKYVSSFFTNVGIPCSDVSPIRYEQYYGTNTFFQGLCHEMDLASVDMHGFSLLILAMSKEGSWQVFKFFRCSSCF